MSGFAYDAYLVAKGPLHFPQFCSALEFSAQKAIVMEVIKDADNISFLSGRTMVFYVKSGGIAELPFPLASGTLGKHAWLLFCLSNPFWVPVDYFY